MAMTLELEQVARFLLGEGELDGVWFGDKPSGEHGSFWWRKHLREAMASLTQPAQAVDVEANTWRIDFADGSRIAVFDEPAPAMYAAVGATITPLYTRALAGEQAGWRDGWSAWHDDVARTWAVRSPTGDVCEVHDKAADVHAEVLRQLAQSLPASPTPDKETQR